MDIEPSTPTPSQIFPRSRHQIEPQKKKSLRHNLTPPPYLAHNTFTQRLSPSTSNVNLHFPSIASLNLTTTLTPSPPPSLANKHPPTSPKQSSYLHRSRPKRNLLYK